MIVDSSEKDPRLSITGNQLTSCDGTIVATVSNALSSVETNAYLNLFRTAPELLEYLNVCIAAALGAYDSITSSRNHIGSHSYPDLPQWIEVAINLVALVSGEHSTIDDDTISLSTARDDPYRL